MSWVPAAVALALATSACAFNPPLDSEPHGTLRLLLTGETGNYLKGEVSIDSKEVEEPLMAKGVFNIEPGAHTLRVKLMTAQRWVGKVRRQFGLTKQLTRSVKLRSIKRCTGGVKFRVVKDQDYEMHIASTGSGTTCLIECARLVRDGQGTLRRERCEMTRAY